MHICTKLQTQKKNLCRHTEHKIRINYPSMKLVRHFKSIAVLLFDKEKYKFKVKALNSRGKHNFN